MMHTLCNQYSETSDNILYVFMSFRCHVTFIWHLTLSVLMKKKSHAGYVLPAIHPVVRI